MDSGWWTVDGEIERDTTQGQTKAGCGPACVCPRADRNPSWLNTRLGSSRTGQTLLQGGVEESIEWEKAQWVRPNGWGKRMAKEGCRGVQESSVERGGPRGGKGVLCGQEDRTRGWASSKPDLPAEQIRLLPAAKH